MKQQSLFTKATGSIALRQQQFRSRPLDDGSVFPFGKNRERGLRMQEVDLSYYRWFLKDEKAAGIRAAWPNVEAYAKTILGGELERNKPRFKRTAPTPSPAQHGPSQSALTGLRDFVKNNV